MKIEDLSKLKDIISRDSQFSIIAYVFKAVIQVYGIRLQKCMESQIS